MNPVEAAIDTTFRQYVDFQNRRHHLLAEGKDHDPELDETADMMTSLWEKLDAAERQRANGMGSDLNWLRRGGEPPPQGRKAEEVTPAERQELLAAQERQDWYGYLHSLRVCAPAIPAAELARLRGAAYDALGMPTYAQGFHELAAALEPSHGSLGVETPASTSG